jgi:hypothetical protein
MSPTIATTPARTFDGAIDDDRRRAVAARSILATTPLGRECTVSHRVNQAAFGALLLAAGDLLFRPADLIPALAGTPIHKLLLIVCTLLATPRLVEVCLPRRLRTNAIAAMLILLVPAVALSHLAHGDAYSARVGGVDMAKAGLFAMLVIALVDSMTRLRLLLASIAAAVFAIATLSVANHHGLVHFSTMMGVDQFINGPQGRTTLTRLCGIGLFNDPNDFALVLVVAMIVFGYGLGERRFGRARFLQFIPIAILGYAVFLTHSRGGALSGAAAVCALVAGRVGWRNTLLLAGPVAVGLAVTLYSRQVNLADPEDTFQSRMRLWSGSLDAFVSAPVFGIGEGKLAERLGQVAHNSFLHAFAEMGVVGGMLFLGVFLLVGRGLWRLKAADAQVARARPYILAIVFGSAVGLCSLTRCYTPSTQLVVALAAAFLGVASKEGAAAALPRLDWRCIRGIAVVATVFLIVSAVFVQFTIVRVDQ